MRCRSNLTNRRKIALFVSNLTTYGGTERVTSLLSKELSDFYNVSIVTLYREGNPVYAIDDNVLWFNCYDFKIQSIKYKFNAGLKIAKYLKKENIEILIVVGRNTSFIPFVVKLFNRKIKIIYCEHNSIKALEFQNAITSKIKNGILNYLIARATDKIVLLTQKEKNIYYKIMKNESKMVTIHNFIDDSLLQNEKFVYNFDNKKIITVGGILFQKGYDYLVEVASMVLKEYPDWTWDIYGNDTDDNKDELNNLIKMKSLDNKLEYKGVVPNIYDLYERYSFMVVTSRWEGLPMTMIEAKIKRLPIVSFDVYSGPSDLIRNGIDGYLVRAWDCKEMAIKICDLIKNKDLRMKFSSNASSNLNMFYKNKILKMWIKLIDEL